jgi:polyhydroxyalkanoate synthesis repressor PhaR
MTDRPEAEPTPAENRRVIKRYSNRKLYDTKDSRYVTLLQIAEMIRANEDVQIIDNATKEDKTDVTLALIISEELKAKPRGIPLATLKALIRQRGERILTQLRDGPMSRFIPEAERGETRAEAEHQEDPVTEGQHAKGIRGTLEQWQHAIDDRIRAVLPTFSTIRDLQTEVSRLADRIDSLEKRLPPSREE